MARKTERKPETKPEITIEKSIANLTLSPFQKLRLFVSLADPDAGDYAPLMSITTAECKAVEFFLRGEGYLNKDGSLNETKLTGDAH